MNNLKKLDSRRLTEIVGEEIPELKFEGVFAWKGSISEREFRDSLKTIRNRNYLQDAIEFFSDTKKQRRAISHDIVYPEQKRDITFQVVDTQSRGPSPHGLIANLYTYNNKGESVKQIAIVDIHF